LDCFLDGSSNRLLADGQLMFFDQNLPDIEESVLFFGPYINLSPGKYLFYFRGNLEGDLNLKFTRNFGESLLEVSLSSFEGPVQLDLDETAEKFEIVASRTNSLKRVNLSGIDVVMI
jgi:hypothetical protein